MCRSRRTCRRASPCSTRVQAAELVAEARTRVLAEAATRELRFEHLARALDVVSPYAAGDDFFRVLECAVRDERVPDDRESLDAAMRRLAAALGLQPGDTEAGLKLAMIEDGLPSAEWVRLAAVLGRSRNKSDHAIAETFARAAAATDVDQRLAYYRAIFFTDKGIPRQRIVTQAVDEFDSERLQDEQRRLESLDGKLRAACAVERTKALFTLAGAIRRRVAEAKARLGALDFDDLIRKTLLLLQRDTAAWVLYKLDRGVDHVLVDEAQDTNPEQWHILRLITEEFTAGHGARANRIRTLFAVGDPKQSIYSFQGADPRWFEDSRQHWLRKTAAARLRFEDVRLDLSFRSARIVLEAVDATFEVAAHYAGLSFGDRAIGTTHQSARPNAPGLVELWPVETKAPNGTEPEAWALPVDELEQSSPPVVVAGRIARAVQAWTRTGDEMGRVWRPKDILVLVRKRGPAFFAVIRALRVAGVPVAGADRFDIGEHIAVLDLVAAGRAALLPNDDLTVATALKSPLVDLTDDDLIRIGADRGDDEAFAEALRRHAEAGDEAARIGRSAVARWRELACGQGPFGFYATLLGPEGGRARLIARLGGEAADAIDAFLCYAHAAELGPDAPSLTTFLAQFESAAHTIKRDLDAAGDEVRVMTVHGAKGLEAPIVILIDGCEVGGDDAPLLAVPAGGNGEPIPVWSPGAKYDCAAVAQARNTLAQRAREEHNRLLYVAMTRAKDRLVIAPFATRKGAAPEEAWCEMVRRSLVEKARGLIRAEASYGPVDLWREEREWPTLPAPVSNGMPAPVARPAWLGEIADPEPEPAPPIRPSSALAAADRLTRPGDGPYAPDARLRGVLVHALLERLPTIAPERRREVARSFVAARAPRLAADDRARLVADALAVLGHAALAPLFGPSSRAEAAIAGHVRLGAEDRPVSGQIDRLAVLDNEILIADYKTTARPPRGDEPAPAPYVAQLALYRALLMDIYPARRVRAFLIWTGGPQVRELRDGELDDALAAIKVP